MLDLVINHTAIDSPLTKQHPEWYAKDEQGRIKNPGAIDPADATKVTVWGDLAGWPTGRCRTEGLLHFWDAVVSKYLGLGFLGSGPTRPTKSRLVLAPAHDGLSRSHKRSFCRDFGLPPEELAQLSDAGFDYLCNSSSGGIFRRIAPGAIQPPAVRPLPSAFRRPTTPTGWQESGRP
jgi:starch synthase (maltosyl-transferring)